MSGKTPQMDFDTMKGFMNMLNPGKKFDRQEIQQAENMWHMFNFMEQQNPEVPFSWMYSDLSAV